MKDFNKEDKSYYEQLKEVYEQNEMLKRDLDEDKKQLFVKDNENSLQREIIRLLESENFYLREIVKSLTGVKK